MNSNKSIRLSLFTLLLMAGLLKGTCEETYERTRDGLNSNAGIIYLIVYLGLFSWKFLFAPHKMADQISPLPRICSSKELN